ncbi:MAG: cob(I)yrinic acid a,c-diamide adenosyltransferase [bacterium]|nr:cob(I)yrinic acid a,c-diamide adenosyltransferase [bacterium]
MEEKGLVYVFTGHGKGKTTAAIGQAVRSVGQGWKVLVVQFIKQVISGEVEPLKKLGVEIYPMGMGYVGILTDQKEKDRHVQAAEQAFDFAKEKISKGKYDLLIMDEINNAIQLDLLAVGEVLEFLNSKPAELSVILTGRDAPREFVEAADLVSEVKEIRHPFSEGKTAKKGIEY